MLHKVAAAAVSLLAGAGLLTAPAAARALADGSTASAVSTTSSPTNRPTCGPEPTDAAGWQGLFDGLTTGWSGGDGAASIRLPDGRLLWLFGDTFTGSVSADGRRGSDARIVRNSMVVTDGSCAAVVTPGRAALPSSDGTWLWPTAGAVTSAEREGLPSVVTVVAQRLRRDAHDALGFARTGTAVVRVTVPWGGMPVVGDVSDLPRSEVLWGAGLVVDGATTWIYGTRAVDEPLVFGRELLLARAPTSSLGDVRTWRYRSAAGWSLNEGDAVVVRGARDGVSTVPSAARVGASYVIVTKPQEFLGDAVVALRAPHPWGPWTTVPLLRAPSGTTVMRYSPALVAGLPGAGAVVVVSRTSTSMAELMADAELARPTFSDVRLD